MPKHKLKQWRLHRLSKKKDKVFTKINLKLTKQRITTIQSKQNNPWRGGRILFPELPHYNTQIVQFLQKLLKNTKKQESVVPLQEKLTQIFQEKENTLDLLDKDFKLII